MSFELGVHLGNAHPQATAESVVTLACAVEDLGYDAVWMTEHVVVAPDQAASYGNVIHPLPGLAFLAARTSRVMLGTSVLVAPLHDPLLLAKQAASLQDLAAGRLRLGLGIGWHLPEFEAMRVPFGERAARTEETIAVLRSLWAGETGFAGRFHHWSDMVFGPRPAIAPEIWVGGSSDAAKRRADRLSLPWHPFMVPPSQIADARRRFPGMRIVPRVTEADPVTLAGSIAAVREAGADGVAAGLLVEPGDAVAGFTSLRDQL